jgi:hypothetical protein
MPVFPTLIWAPPPDTRRRDETAIKIHVYVCLLFVKIGLLPPSCSTHTRGFKDDGLIPAMSVKHTHPMYECRVLLLLGVRAFAIKPTRTFSHPLSSAHRIRNGRMMTGKSTTGRRVCQ